MVLFFSPSRYAHTPRHAKLAGSALSLGTTKASRECGNCSSIAERFEAMDLSQTLPVPALLDFVNTVRCGHVYKGGLGAHFFSSEPIFENAPAQHRRVHLMRAAEQKQNEN